MRALMSQVKKAAAHFASERRSYQSNTANAMQRRTCSCVPYSEQEGAALQAQQGTLCL